jgi:tRNA (cmo5U34)-methyltransferase
MERDVEREWDRAVAQRALKLDGNTDVVRLFEQERWNLYRYPDPGDTPSRLFDQLQWLTAAGFRDVDVYWMRAGHAIFGGAKPM